MQATFSINILLFSENPQILTPKNLNLNWDSGSGFGYAISKEKNSDVDNNGHADFATGAPFDEKVVLLKTRKATGFESTVNFIQKPSSIDPKDSSKINSMLKSQ